MDTKIYDIAVVGGGPAGYSAAIRGRQIGAKVALIEKDKLGGTCLNHGCVPTKFLLYNSSKFRDIKYLNQPGFHVPEISIDYNRIIGNQKQVQEVLIKGIDKLIKKNLIDLFYDQAFLENPNTLRLIDHGKSIKAKKIILASGASNIMPPIKGIDSEGVLDSKQILGLTKIPKSLIIIGGGVIGIEMAEIFNGFGSTITVIEKLPNILEGIDKDCVKHMQKLIENKGIKLILDTQILNIQQQSTDHYYVNVLKKGKEIQIEGDTILASTGRSPFLKGLGLENVGIHTEKGTIDVDENMQTTVSGIYAAGDILGKHLFAHVAFHEGKVAAENAMCNYRSMDYRAVPKVVFTNPQVGSVGLTKEDAEKKGYRAKTGFFPLAYNSQALVTGAPEGFIKYIADIDSEEVLGLHIVTPHAADLILEGTLAIHHRMTLDELIEVIHIHPSFSEGLHEAALAGLGTPLHSYLY